CNSSRRAAVPLLWKTRLQCVWAVLARLAAVMSRRRPCSKLRQLNSEAADAMSCLLRQDMASRISRGRPAAPRASEKLQDIKKASISTDVLAFLLAGLYWFTSQRRLAGASTGRVVKRASGAFPGDPPPYQWRLSQAGIRRAGSLPAISHALSAR